MKFVFVLATIIAAVPAMAQTAGPTAFVPYVVDEKANAELLNILNDVPLRYAVPILRVLNALEARAATATAKDHPQ